MRVVLDAQALLEPLAGIGRVVSNLIPALAQVDPGSRFDLYYGASLRRRIERLPRFDAANLQPMLIRFPGKLFRPLTERMNILPVGFCFRHADVFHGLNYYVPGGIGCPSLVSIYDMSCWKFPHCFTPRRLKDILGKVKRAVRNADRIVTGSESARRDIVEELGVERDRVTVVPLGVSEDFKPEPGPEELERVRGKYRLPERYVLTVGTLEPRKNIALLVRAFRAAGLDGATLVICGHQGWMQEEFAKELGEASGRGEVVLAGPVDDADLPAVYAGARLFAYPSLYEGFGLPPLEAMACGVPVVSSGSSSLPEVLGEAGLLVDPRDEDAWVKALRVLWQDEARLAEMREAGLERAAGFSWMRSAEMMLEVYGALAHSGKRGRG